MRKNSYQESSYTQNRLDIAFIAQNSKEVYDSSSVSMSQDNNSISNISKAPSLSPIIGFTQLSMDQWPSFQKQPAIFKNNSIQQQKREESSDEQQVEKLDGFRKKRLGNKMKVITVKARSNETNPYLLRSRMKNNNLLSQSDSNSSQEIRNLVQEMQDKQKRDINFFLKNTQKDQKN